MNQYSCVHKTHPWFHSRGWRRRNTQKGTFSFTCIKNPSEARRVLTQHAGRDAAPTLATSSSMYKQGTAESYNDSEPKASAHPHIRKPTCAACCSDERLFSRGGKANPCRCGSLSSFPVGSSGGCFSPFSSRFPSLSAFFSPTHSSLLTNGWYVWLILSTISHNCIFFSVPRKRQGNRSSENRTRNAFNTLVEVGNRVLDTPCICDVLR